MWDSYFRVTSIGLTYWAKYIGFEKIAPRPVRHRCVVIPVAQDFSPAPPATTTALRSAEA
jgi:hypothetical protein